MANKETKNVSSFFSLPDDLLLECLVRVPRRYYETLSSVSKKLKALVCSPELYYMRSLLNKDPIYLSFCNMSWIFIVNVFLVDSEIYFIGGYSKPKEVQILDTRSGKLRQGPVMHESISPSTSIVGLIDGKIYVIQELENGKTLKKFLDLESQTWKVVGVSVPDDKNTEQLLHSCVTLEGKVYVLDYRNIITVYNPRQGGRAEKLEMPVDDDRVWYMCVAREFLFAYFIKCGLMWRDTKVNVWRVVSGDVQTLHRKFYGMMAEYYGKLAFFWIERDTSDISTTKKRKHIETSTTTSKAKQQDVWCALVTLDRVEEGVSGTIEWSGVVATIPYPYEHFLHCLVASH